MSELEPGQLRQNLYEALLAVGETCSASFDIDSTDPTAQAVLQKSCVEWADGIIDVAINGSAHSEAFARVMKEIQTFQAPTKEIVEALGDVTLDLKNPKQTRRDVETFQTGFQAGLISQLGSKLDPIS